MLKISDKYEKLKKENEIDKEEIMEEVVFEWNSNLKQKNKQKDNKICDNHTMEQEKKDYGDTELLRFEILERVSLCQDARAIYFIFHTVKNLVTDENKRKRTPEEKEKRAVFYGLDVDCIAD